LAAVATGQLAVSLSISAECTIATAPSQDTERAARANEPVIACTQPTPWSLEYGVSDPLQPTGASLQRASFRPADPRQPDRLRPTPDQKALIIITF
jgi:hypothetical protein